MITYGHHYHLYLEKDSPAVQQARQQCPEANIDQCPTERGPPRVSPTCLTGDPPIFSEEGVRNDGDEVGVLGRGTDVQGAKGDASDLGSAIG